MKNFLLGILAGAIIVCVAGVVLIFAAIHYSAKKPPVPDSGLLMMDIDGSVPEALAETPPLPVLERQSPVAVVEWWKILHTAGRDSRVKGILLRPHNLTAGWAKLQELRSGIETFRKSGKPVYAWLESPSLREYYLASAATRIYLAPEDFLNIKGLRVEATYYKGSLDKLGVQFEVEHMGKYKDAGDMFTRKDMSPETKEALNALLDGVWSTTTGAIAPARGLTPEQFRSLVDESPMLAAAALKNHLVDELSYLPAVEQALARKAGLPEPTRITPRLLLGDLYEANKAQRVAFLVAEGDILRGSVTGPFGEDLAITPAPVTQLAKNIAEDPGIKGVIVRVESPGGDAIASDEILQTLKELSRKKPVVISMSDVAASGGYYIAMTGDSVVAYPNTITGSIGVIYGKVNLKGLYDKLGISTDSLKRGRFADIDSATQSLTPDERKKLRESIESIYAGFLQRVADGRRASVDTIEPLAQGRVWIGTDAYRNRLVDELGGIDRAIEVLRRKAKIPADREVQLTVYPGRRSFWERLMGIADSTNADARSPERLLLERAGRQTGLLPFVDGGMLRTMPYRVEIR
jgi:protease-4